MNYIVMDMEWNQPASPNRTVTEPVRLVGEIVQIGAVKLDDRFEPRDTFQIMVAPRFYKKMNRTVSKLTGITNEDLKSGLPLSSAIELFREWCGDEYEFIIWGWDDIKMLEDNMKVHGMDITWIPPSYNLQPIYNDQTSGEEGQVSLTKAMETLGLEAEEAHDALNDAKNTARICLKLDMADGLRKYSTFKIPLRNSGIELADIESRRIFKKRAEAFSDRTINTFKCLECGGTAQSDKWIRQNGDKFVSLYKCSCGKEYFVRLRFRKNGGETLKAGIIVYALTDEYRELYDTLTEKQALKAELFKERERLKALARASAEESPSDENDGTDEE